MEVFVPKPGPDEGCGTCGGGHTYCEACWNHPGRPGMVPTKIFYDSWGQPWEFCSAEVVGAEAFGPLGVARKCGPETPTYSEAAKEERISEVEGWVYLV
jgi:hypothetical protein